MIPSSGGIDSTTGTTKEIQKNPRNFEKGKTIDKSSFEIDQQEASFLPRKTGLFSSFSLKEKIITFYLISFRLEFLQVTH